MALSKGQGAPEVSAGETQRKNLQYKYAVREWGECY